MHAGTLTFNADIPGTYHYLCPAPGHRPEGHDRQLHREWRKLTFLKECGCRAPAHPAAVHFFPCMRLASAAARRPISLAEGGP
jgi:hypothetical protein